MNNTFDILIVGGGPAGLIAAKEIVRSDKNISIALIEKSMNYQKSIVCGEGVWKTPFEKLITPNPKWIKFEITKASFESADFSQVILGDGSEVMGYILDRALMQEELLQEQVNSGITLYRGERVSDIISEGEHHKIELDSGKTLQATVVIDASGPNSKLGRAHQIEFRPTDLEPAYYAIVDGVEYPSDTVALQMSSLASPGGYVWVFPYGENQLNIGVVLGKKYVKEVDIKELVKETIKKRYPTGTIRSFHGGAIPSFSQKQPYTADNFIQCGDAASLVNPMTRSGISESMKSGEMAAQTALAMLAESDSKKRIKLGKEYEKKLNSEYAGMVGKLAKVKKSLYNISDKQFNSAAKKLGEIQQNEITMLKILQTTIIKSPQLLWAMRHML